MTNERETTVSEQKTSLNEVIPLKKILEAGERVTQVLGTKETLITISPEQKEKTQKRILEEIQHWCEEETQWRTGFDDVKMPPRCSNECKIGVFKRTQISDDPLLFAVCFTQKMGKSNHLKNGFNFFVTPDPLTKEDFINDWDNTPRTELVGFNIEFGYDSNDGRSAPNRHSLKHRIIKPPLNGNGFGTKILQIYEDYFGQLAQLEGKIIRNVIDTQVWSTLNWALKNGYKPEEIEDSICLKELLTEGTFGNKPAYYYTKYGKLYTKDGKKIFIRLKKDFGEKK